MFCDNQIYNKININRQKSAMRFTRKHKTFFGKVAIKSNNRINSLDELIR